MNTVPDRIRPIRMRVVAIALGVMFAAVGPSCSTHRTTNQQSVSGTSYSSRRMADGRVWLTENLNVNVDQSYCYDDSELNCRRYGRLYTWEAAQQACRSLGAEWRLPTDDDWRQLARRYGGVSAESDDSGRGAYQALVIGGSSGFNAVLGGGRGDGQYARLEAHGFYWTASENDPANAPFYNFGKGGLALHRQGEGEKQRAFSVRCVRQ